MPYPLGHRAPQKIIETADDPLFGLTHFREFWGRDGGLASGPRASSRALFPGHHSRAPPGLLQGFPGPAKREESSGSRSRSEIAVVQPDVACDWTSKVQPERRLTRWYARDRARRPCVVIGVSVLISVTSDTSPTGDLLVTPIFRWGEAVLSLLRRSHVLPWPGTLPGAALPKT